MTKLTFVCIFYIVISQNKSFFHLYFKDSSDEKCFDTVHLFSIKDYRDHDFPNTEFSYFLTIDTRQ